MDYEQIRQRAQEYVEREQDEKFRSEVVQLIAGEDRDELTDRFYTDLEFGTGGLRGIVGGGFNRMNSLVVRRASEGLARYVTSSVKAERGENASAKAVIAYDSRHFSDHFAHEAALVLCGHGIETWLFDALRPTPELSFAVRRLGADTGIVVTASHNPSEYSGYKVYWNDGSQVVPPHDKGIIEEVNAVGSDIASLDSETAVRQNLLHRLGHEMDSAFLDMVERRIIRRELFDEHASRVSVIYTPLHGTGSTLIEPVFSRLNVPISVVPEQQTPDGDFPTVKFPNPEEGAALRLAIEQGVREKADLIVGTDPDADRVGIAVPRVESPSSFDDYQLVTGNQLGVLLADYIFSSMTEKHTLPVRPAFVKTIVTTELQRAVAEYYGAEVYDTLTGFKHIAALIRKWEGEEGAPAYVLGDEESYGFMIGTEVRDKDAISATVLAVEMALYHVTNGKSVLGRLEEIYQQFGYYEEHTISSYFKGQDGAKVMSDLMTRLRDTPPTHFAGVSAVKLHDYLQRKTTDPEGGRTLGTIELPESNVLKFELADGTSVAVRPSGTEPKIKFYLSVHAEANSDPAKARIEVGKRLAAFEQDIRSLLPG